MTLEFVTCSMTVIGTVILVVGLVTIVKIILGE